MEQDVIRRRVAGFGAVAGVLAIAAPALGGSYTVEFGGPGGTWQALGVLETFQTQTTLAGFYDYFDAEYHGEIGIEPNTVTMFLIEATDGMGFVAIGGENDGLDTDGGMREGWLEWHAKVQTDPRSSFTDLVVQDDGGESKLSGSGRKIDVRAEWVGNKTDGIAALWDGAAGSSIEIATLLTDAITSFRFLGSDGSLSLDGPDDWRNVRLTRDGPSEGRSIPLPTPAGLVVVAVAGFGGLSRGRCPDPSRSTMPFSRTRARTPRGTAGCRRRRGAHRG